MSRVALVTGGMGGLGEAVCIKLAALGYKVVTTYSPGNPKVQDWLNSMNNMGYGFKAYACDVTDFDSAKNCVETVTQEVGPVDVLVNNAGITRDMTFKRMTKADWDAVMHTNLKGIFNCTKAVSKLMMKQRYGRIINMASVVGVMGNAGQANYAAAKAGVIGFTKSMAKELASRNITVNAVAPGYISTDMTANLPEQARLELQSQIPLQRLGNPEDVAAAVLFLVSPGADYITGQTIHVDGGMVM